MPLSFSDTTVTTVNTVTNVVNENLSRIGD
jgi:hypothetical protein